MQVDGQAPHRGKWEGRLQPGVHQVRVFEHGEQGESLQIVVAAGGKHLVKQDEDGNLTPFSDGAVYEENPTISYTPVAGAEYARQVFSPVPIAVLAQMTGTLADPGYVIINFRGYVVEMSVPVLAALALELGVSPVTLTVPVALAASCAFMLPVATPPNAIVFGSGMLTIPKMVRAGLMLNIIGIFLVSSVALFLAPKFL